MKGATPGVATGGASPRPYEGKTQIRRVAAEGAAASSAPTKRTQGGYCLSSFLPALRLSKFKMVLRTSE